MPRHLGAAAPLHPLPPFRRWDEEYQNARPAHGRGREAAREHVERAHGPRHPHVAHRIDPPPTTADSYGGAARWKRRTCGNLMAHDPRSVAAPAKVAGVVPQRPSASGRLGLGPSALPACAGFPAWCHSEEVGRCRSLIDPTRAAGWRTGWSTSGGRTWWCSGLPRGGVPVAFEVAERSARPLDVIVVRKLGVPFQPELAMGAIGEDGVRVVDDDVVRSARSATRSSAPSRPASGPSSTAGPAASAATGPARRWPGAPRCVVDDGIATGSTARAACQVARAQGAARVVLAVPVGPPDSVDRAVGRTPTRWCAWRPLAGSSAIGQFYDDFSQTSDEEVVDLLERAARSTAAGPSPLAGRRPAGARRGGRGRRGAGAPGGAPHGSRRRGRRRRVRARQRQQPPQPPQPVRRRRCCNEAGLGHAAVRPAHPGRRSATAPTSSTSTLLAGRLVDVTALAARAARASRRCPSATSAPAPVPPPRCGRPPNRGADVAAVVSRGGRPDLAGRAARPRSARRRC